MSRSTRLTLICHGATSASRAGTFPLDEPLDNAEAERGVRLSGAIRHAARVVTSPALRARQTATLLGLEAPVLPVLRDLDHGRWAGLSLADIHATEPEGLSVWLTDPDAAPHGGEPVASLVARVSDWLDNERDAGGHTVAVTHAAVVRAAVLAVLKAPLSSFWTIDIAPLTLTELTSDGRRFALRSLGRPLV